GAGVHDAAINAIALLIITCPCALGLAVPAVQVVATGRLFRNGVLVKSGDALERLAEADYAVFDKTGTLTRATFSLTNAETISADDLEHAARLARASRHPLSRAVAERAGKGVIAEDVAETPGCGVEGVIDGAKARLGTAAWAGVENRSNDGDNVADGPVVWLAVEGRAPVRFAFLDAPREDAAETIRELREKGFDVEMMTGDGPGAAGAAARAVGIDAWRALAAPKDKTARLDELAAQDRKVLMVGDGLNDAPAIARAHVSMSPGTAADVSQNAADFVFQGDRLEPVADTILAARAARRRVLENFAFAAAYNLVAAPMAAAGLVTPLIAAIAMSSSSLIVTLNALRLARGGPR
ncbi:MAG: HAD-IC family P-type ATPase, partial [Maricaulaceae bacterium]